MSTQQPVSSLGSEGGNDGSFRRQDSTFRDAVSADGSTDFPLEAGRYHLYVARACPWAHRTLIVRELMGLQEAVGVSFVNPLRDERGWEFSGGEYVDEVNGFRFLSEAYAIADPDYEARVSVPVLWDTRSGTIVCNESADIVRMLSTAFAPLAEHPVELYPERLRGDIDDLNETIYDSVNNAVYKAGFATRQAVYEHEVRELFATLGALVRFDAVYQIHFKCSIRKLVEYENLWPYTRDLYQWPGVAETVEFDEIRAHYYRTHPMINPSGLVAMRPAASFDEPAGRS